MSATAVHSDLMDSVYRRQRYIYDFTRKYYLFGRDRLISGLALKPGESLVEIGCGTARNLIRIAKLYPGTTLYGLDASAEMLKSAEWAVDGTGLSGRIHLAQGLAEQMSSTTFGIERPFDHALFSYALSMIPDWKQALKSASASLGPTGIVHIVDFGDLTGLGTLGRTALTNWLSLFHVSPRSEIVSKIERIARNESAGNAYFSMLPARYAFIWRGSRAGAEYLAY
jgi:S-adenosylmethionine-diacylgycerolhomoserine-N-methlytransferase